jgi:hypothetical protein
MTGSYEVQTIDGNALIFIDFFFLIDKGFAAPNRLDLPFLTKPISKCSLTGLPSPFPHLAMLLSTRALQCLWC